MEEAMILFLAGAMPFEKLVADLKKATTEYENSTTDEKRAELKKEILIASLLVVTKEKVDAEGGFINAVKDFERAKEAYDIGSRINGTDQK